MSRMSQLVARTAVPTLLAFHGETVVHWPAGSWAAQNQAAADDVTAIVDRSEQTPEIAGGDDANGERVPVTAELTMRADVVVTTYEKRNEQASVFVFDDRPWWATAVGGTDRGDGLQRVTVRRMQGKTTKRTRG